MTPAQERLLAAVRAAGPNGLLVTASAQRVVLAALERRGLVATTPHARGAVAKAAS